MTQSAMNEENFEESIQKCKKINKIAHKLSDSIQKMQLIDDAFGLNLHLKNAKDLFFCLDDMPVPETLEEKISWLNDYREHLVAGLNDLTEFFESVVNFQALTETQRNKVLEITEIIKNNQRSIIKIAAA